MIKKILITIVVLSLIVVIGYICKDISTTSTYADNNNDRFIKINDQLIGGYYLNIVYDKETKIEYALFGRGGIQVLVDAEGKPLLYEEGV